MKPSVHDQHSELDLLDLLKILLAKIKLIICVALVAAILGGAFGFAFTLIGNHDFGTRIEFYITPDAPDSQILHLLSSERFAEKLMLDENGLPEGSSGAEYEAALAAKLESKAADAAYAEAKRASKSAPRELAAIQKTYEEKQKAYDDAYDMLSVYQSASDEIAKQPEHIEKMKKYEAAVEAAKEEKTIAEKDYYAASQKALEATNNLEAAKEAAANARKVADDLAEEILKVWREQSQNKKKISMINESLKYDYIEDSSSKNSEDNINRQFLVVSISVEKDEQLANKLLDSLCDKLPAYVEENTDTDDSIEETECILISTAAEVEDLGKNSLVKEVIKYALISTIAALAVTCILVMWIGVKQDGARRKNEYAENGDINAPLV
ncbi:MAG: hypothetical protein J6M03_04390 [Clostridia bacterium]|nr:hypothetical protein [Clostridia bacterium]